MPMHRRLSLPKGLDTAMPRPPWGDVFISWLGAFLAILAISGANQALLPELHATLLVASFGAQPWALSVAEQCWTLP